MVDIKKAAEKSKGQMASALTAGLKTISESQEVTFSLYVRVILPLDGFLFWVKADLLSPPGSQQPGLPARPVGVPLALRAQGSLHWMTTTQQTDIASQGLNNVLFTTSKKIEEFNATDSDCMYIGEVDGAPFSFSWMGNRYEQADLYHYRGESIYPVMRSQMITSLDDFRPHELVVSNCLPILIALNSPGGKSLSVYPSFLIPQNVVPPYVVVDVKNTRPLQMAPLIVDGERWQHVMDTVRVTLFGLDNARALQYVDYIVTQAMLYEQFGISNSPVPLDDKMNQREINAIAMKKHVDFEINYYQQAANLAALKYIKSVFVNWTFKI